MTVLVQFLAAGCLLAIFPAPVVQAQQAGFARGELIEATAAGNLDRVVQLIRDKLLSTLRMRKGAPRCCSPWT